MKSSSFIFILFIIGSVRLYSISNTDKCSGRWQIIDKLNIKITLDWQISPLTNIFVTEFRTNLVTKGFWYAFGLSSSSDNPAIGIVYALRWRENDTQIFWDIYNITESNVTILNQNDSSLVTFQRLFSSGLLTVQPILYNNKNLTSLIIEKQCLYFVYMRGRFSGDTPLAPDEIRSNRSLCLTCQRFELTSTIDDTTIQSVNDLTSELTSTMEDTTSLVVNDSTTEKINLLDRHTSSLSLPSSDRTELNFFWLGRILNRLWLNDYFNLSSSLSQSLRLDLQNLFLSLINSNSSFTFICDQFDFYTLQSGSILFVSNITLISNLSEDHTMNIIKKLIKTLNNSEDYKLNFDPAAHHIKRTNEISQISVLLKSLSRTGGDDLSKKAEINFALRLLIGSLVGLGSLMVLIISILCLYGYYKCRRRQFRLFTQRQTLKIKHDINAYTWLGQQPSLNSSPYLIQSTSI